MARPRAFELLDSCTTSEAAADGNLGGHIVVDAAGAFAYATNRGDDAIAVLSIDGDRVRLVDTVESGGTSPRFLCWIDGGRGLLAAHEEAGPITGFVRADGGRLTPQGPVLDVDKAAWLMTWQGAG